MISDLEHLPRPSLPKQGDLAPAFAGATKGPEAGDGFLQIVGKGSGKPLTTAERLAQVTGRSVKEMDERLTTLKGQDPDGNKLTQLNSILTACEKLTNFKPSADVLFSNKLKPEELGAYRELIEGLGKIHNVLDYTAPQIKSMNRTILAQLDSLGKAIKDQNSEAIAESAKAIQKTRDWLNMVTERVDGDESVRVLKPGIHTYTLDQVKEEFAYNPWREHLYEGLVNLLKELKTAGCKRVYLNGGFCTGKVEPGDYDLTWEPQGVDINKLDPVLLKPDWRSNPARKAKYLGDIIIRDRALTGHDHVEQWQRDLRIGIIKGLITIDLDKVQF
jgi:hypothetical protein